MSIVLPDWMGPSTSTVSPRETYSSMSKMSGVLVGPVSSLTSSARSEDERWDEVEDGIDERIRREHAEQAIHDGATGGFADRRDATVDSEPLVGRDDCDHEAEEKRLRDTDRDVGGRERRADLLEIVARVEAEKERRAHPPAEGDETVGNDGERGKRDAERGELRRDQILDRIEVHRAERIDLAVRCHRGEFAGDGRRAARHDEQRDDERPHFTSAEPANGQRAHRFGAVLLELIRNLKRRDQADENRRAGDESNRADAEHVELARDAAADDRARGDDDPAQPLDRAERDAATIEKAAAGAQATRWQLPIALDQRAAAAASAPSRAFFTSHGQAHRGEGLQDGGQQRLCAGGANAQRVSSIFLIPAGCPSTRS